MSSLEVDEAGTTPGEAPRLGGRPPRLSPEGVLPRLARLRPPSSRAAPSPWAAAAAGVAFPEVLLVEEVGAAAFLVGARPSVEEEEAAAPLPCRVAGRT